MLLCFFTDLLPEEIAIHFNLMGEADGFLLILEHAHLLKDADE